MTGNFFHAFILTLTVLVSGCGTPMTLGQFVRGHVKQNHGLRYLVASADGGAAAFNAVADTPIRKIRHDAATRKTLKVYVDNAPEASPRFGLSSASALAFA